MTNSVKQKFRWGLTPKLVTLLVIFAVVPMGVIAFIGVYATYEIQKSVGNRLSSQAQAIADKIDRNLFERYGDVQAFAQNRIVQERSQWYQAGEKSNEIVKVMNGYNKTYGIYSLSIMVDLQGDVIAVNSRNANGEEIQTTHLYKKNYRNAPWFIALEKDTYTTTMPFTEKGNDTLTGTYVEDVHVDEDVKLAYPDSSGLTLGFSSRVYQDEDVIGYWTNRAKFSLVEDFIQQGYRELKITGAPNAELTMLDAQGRVIIDYDPIGQQTQDVLNDMDVVLKFNLVNEGFVAAREAIAGKTGSIESIHIRKQTWQLVGYTHLKGALGFAGMNWAVLVRVPFSEAYAQAYDIHQTLMMAVFICVGLIFPLGVFAGRKVVKRLKPVMDIAGRAAQNDLTQRVPVSTNDELGQMGIAFNEFLDRLTIMLKEIEQVVQTVASSSEELSSNGREVSRTSQEQSCQATRVATAVDDMSAMAGKMVQHTQELSETAHEVNQSAVKGGEVVARSISGMELVSSTMQTSADRINALGQYSQEIGEIIRVIEDIADQTNLLALNAAIEAARAGEQGRGFAVVADEVRKLAERTSKATKEITGVIETVQAGTIDAVQSMEAGTSEVKNGMQLAQTAGQRLEEIVYGVQRVANMINQIAGSTEEQSQVTGQIAQSIQTVASLSHKNENSVGQVASATSDLAQMASDLQTSLGRFQLLR